jgi:hypothetical protein
MVVLVKPIDAPIEVAEDDERHKFLCGFVDPCLKGLALRRQGHAVGIGRVLEAAVVAPGLQVDTKQPKQLVVFLQKDFGAPSDRPTVCGVDHAEAREVALADGIEHTAPDSKARVDAIRALLRIRIGRLAGHEILDVPR